MDGAGAADVIFFVLLGWSPAGKTEVLPPFLPQCDICLGSKRAALLFYTLRVLLLVFPLRPLGLFREKQRV